MESCGKCIYLAIIGDPKEAINECHRFPPQAMGKDMAVYPLVKNDQQGCGEYTTVEQFMKAVEKMTIASAASPTTARARISAARNKALR